MHQNKGNYLPQLDAITSSLMNSYKSWSFSHGAAWTHQRDLFWIVLRSAFIFQATEMINCAFWKIWECKDTACFLEDGAHTKTQTQCVLIKKLVQRAIWYLRVAQEMSLPFSNTSTYDTLRRAKTETNGWGLLYLVDSVQLDHPIDSAEERDYSV